MPHIFAKTLSAVHLGFRPVLAIRDFLVPATVLVLPGDPDILARRSLFARSPVRGRAGRRVTGEGLGIDSVGPLGPAAIVLDDVVDDLAHDALS